MVTVWSKRAQAQLRKAYEYIVLDSVQNAEMVVNQIVDQVTALVHDPQKYPPDKFKKANDGTWRAFEKHHYRVSYRIMPKQIRIVRLRHTSNSPLKY